MGKIVQLQNKKTGENEYPRTYTKAIIDDQATPLDTLMQNQNDKIAELGSYVENNPEYARAYTDAEGRFLWGIKQDGSVEFTKGIPSSIKKYIDSLDRNNDEEVERINQLVIGLLADVKVLTDTYHYISNPEWACAIVDSEERILMGIKADGSYYIPNKELYHVAANPEWLKVVTDLEGRVLFGIKNNGSCYIPKGISEEAKQGLLELTSRISLFENIFSNIENPEWFSITTDSDGKILEGIEKGGKKYFPKQEMFEKYNDIEGRTEITLDAEGRIVSYRDSNGAKHEHKQHTEEASFDSMILNDKNGLQIAESLKKVGFTTDVPSDFSLSDSIELPIPRVAAKVRLLVPKMPTSKTADIEGYLEYNDKDGNYFKKAIVLNSQGSSSMSYIRPDGSQGNLGVDFVDCEIKFGTWVSQDSFHIKKYYIDAFRGQCVVGYHLMEQVYQTHPYGSKHPYEPKISFDSFSTSSGSIKKDFNTGALCHPDGFPIVIYVNTGGEDVFYGVYAWCLKKHRDNYYCDKKNPNNIILDGLITTNTLFGGSVNWSEFEIRNPKDLIDINGGEYDGENPKELSNSDELSAAVKANIVRLSGVVAAMTANNSRETFEQYFMPTYYIDYYIISQVLYNVDGFHKNWIWCTWDGQHWTPTLYDVDSIFGMMPIGTYVREETADGILISETITNYLASLYKDEIEERYKELRDKGVFTVDNIVGLLDSWLKRIGYSNLKDDLQKFNQTPSYRSSQLNSSNWKIINYSWDANKNDYDNEKTYEIGNRCYSYGYELEAITQSVGVPPFKDVYSNHPRANGFYNSLLRVKNWVEKRLNFLDSQYNYIY